ncbi:MAG TPA: class I SAM-dependent methyltransferase [Stellaceae bacterium]|jgi:predicted O-methyltransferase YrrM|nr:class I SAM-dependent methyltransferase [Stellaceae bacterium]
MPSLRDERAPADGDEGEAFEFTADWFSAAEPTWRAIFQQLIPDARKILEIGCYEGRSVVWLIKNGFRRGMAGDLYCIDNWKGSVEHSSATMQDVFARFKRNVERAYKAAPAITVHRLEADSRPALAKLYLEGHGGSFDFVYVDASHQAPDVLSDLVLAFELCRVGGIVACDDYLWNFGRNPLHTPKIAIDAFVNCYAAKLTPVSGVPLYQFFFKKIAA